MFEVSPKVATVVSVVMAVICIGGAVALFTFGPNNGIVFETLLLGIVFSLVLGAMIRRQRR